MQISINRDSDIPIHDQLVTQFSLQIAAGLLTAGTRLPSVRAVAMRLGIHRNTVLAVYRALEALGMVVTHVGSGVRVADQRSAHRQEGWREGVTLKALVETFLNEALAQGFSRETVTDAVNAALQPRTVHRLIVADPHPDVHPIYRHELDRSLPVGWRR